MNPYYITTPIYYVNDRPHIGHCYSTLIADVGARFQRLVRGEGKPDGGSAGEWGGAGARGGGVFLLTGTDEHADKVVTSAAEHNTSPQAWADKNAAEFRAAFAFMNCSYDDFIRTTEPRHKDKVSGYIRRLLDSGDIYKGEYTGWYDAGQEEYVTETAAKEAGYKSAISGRPLIKRTEPCYFFRLSAYQEKLQAYMEANPSFVQPEARRSEVMGRLRQGLQDVPVSRPVTEDPSTQWGIRMPGDEANRIYVWIDALFNYLTTVDTPERRELWPPAVHLIGKDILWFHAVIWPALLMALGEPLPRMVFGHGWWISEGMKMSKSLGNFVDLEKLKAYADRYSLDALRWYLVTQGPLTGTDADFAHAKFIEVYNADLANGIGNCASRVGNMIDKYFGGKVPSTNYSFAFYSRTDGNTPLDLALQARAAAGSPVAPGYRTRGFDFPKIVQHSTERLGEQLERFDLGAAARCGIELVREVDDFISHTAPFTLAKRLGDSPEHKDALAAILYTCAEALRIAAVLLIPAMPQKMTELLGRWSCLPREGAGLAELARFGGEHALAAGTGIVKGEALFMRADPAEGAPGVG